MPHWGGAESSSWGAVSDMLLRCLVEDLGDGLGCRITLRAAAGYGGRRWDVVVAGRAVANVPVGEDSDAVLTVPYVWDWSRPLPSVPVSVCNVGDWTEPTADSAGYQLGQTEQHGMRCVILRWDAVPEATEVHGDAGLLGAATLGGSGITRGIGRLIDRENEFDLDWEYEGGVMALAVTLGGTVLARGERSTPGIVALDAVDGSGISGTLVWGGATSLPEGMTIRVRWPAEHRVYLYPTGETPALAATVPDSGNLRQAATIDGLEPGVYDYFVRAVSSTATVGANSAAQGSVTVLGVPLPPTELACTRPVSDPQYVEWVDSETPGATYRIYCGDVGEPIDFSAVHDTVGAGVEEWALPEPSGDGVARVCVEAVLAGVESGYRRVIEVEWLDGVRVLPRPNAPAFGVKARVGLALTADWVYSPEEQEVEPVAMRLYLRSEDGTTVSHDEDVSGERGGTITCTAVYAGWTEYAVVALGPDAALSAVDYRGPVWLSVAVPAAPANVAAELV